VGGLLALFLGASVVTVVELFDIALCRRRRRHGACAGADRKRKSRDRKSPAENSSNHVASLPVGSNHRGVAPPALKSATLPASVMSNNKTTSSNCATVPRQKVVCVRQAETDI